ncbi:hypothetical protein [Cellulomonas septica]|uniref:Uncharacterized protein n=1 Tax=Cellulomonas septica TaxID=285080 RepID=A0ABX1K4P9_9CELL|nr:hypothetical protein [Cellulomonas septica]NKY40602.1 hypothetical protein [Cellulomonas septica]
MKGALVLSEDAGLFGVARDVIVGRGGTAVEDTAQLRGPDGFLLTLFRDEYPGDDFREQPFTPADGVEDVPQMTQAHGLPVECRSEVLFVDVVRAIAAAAGRPVWVLDNESVLWAAERLDPATISL